MRIIYKQAMPSGALLDSFGIQNCYFKHLFTERDSKGITHKRHCHTDYEIHMVEKGCLTYEVDQTQYELKCGHFLLLPPQMPHRALFRSPGASTISITFRRVHDRSVLPELCSSMAGEISPRIWDTIRLILSEYRSSQLLSAQLITANILEILMLLWRLCGVKEISVIGEENDGDPRLVFAKQYIADNIELAPTISDISAYCHISTKQLERLFVQAEGITPAAYIQKQRIRRIQTLLRSSDLSLRSISERMHFSSEYYFNSFFKKHEGMAPGEFRNMHALK